MKFSIIITGYNQKNVVCDAIRSALGQSYHNVEVIYVDDASTDGSVASIQSIFDDCRLRIIQAEENRGSSVARLMGINKATGDWCLIVDGDDTLCLNACEVLSEVIAAQDEKTDIVGFGANVISSEAVAEEAKRWMESMVCEPLLGAHSAEELLNIQYKTREKSWILWNKCFRMDVLRAAGVSASYDPFYRLTDFYLCFLACCEGNKYFGIPEPLYNYYYGPGVSVRLISADEMPRFMSAFKAPALLTEYAEKKGVLEEYETCFKAVESETINCSLERVLLLPDEDVLRASQMFIDAFGAKGVSVLLNTIREQRNEINQINQINHSVSFRLGRAMTWLPRKLTEKLRRKRYE